VSEISFGYSESQITPDRAITLEGYEFRGSLGAGNSGVLDHVYAKALSLVSGDTEILILSLEVCEFTPAFALRLRRSIAARTGLDPVRIAVTATHTHSGPVLDNVWGARELPAEVRERHDRAIAAYLDDLVEAVSVISSQARIYRRPCTVSYARHSAVLGYNRRKRHDAAEEMLMSLWEPPGEVPNGLYDPEVPVVMLEALPDAAYDNYLTPRGTERVVLFNAAFHPVVLGQMSRMVSGDYPGAACRKIEHYLGAGTRALFLLGACGDTHPFISTQANPRAVEIVGDALAAGVAGALAGRTRQGSQCVLSSGTDTLRNTVSPENSIEIQVLALGDVAFVGISAEIFTEFGIRIRERSPFRTTLISTNTNGSVWYVPTADAFSSGEYEVDIATERGFDRSTFDTLVERVVTLLEQLRR
jgi:hypothetical protein